MSSGKFQTLGFRPHIYSEMASIRWLLLVFVPRILVQRYCKRWLQRAFAPCIPEQRYRKCWLLATALVPIIGVALLLFIVIFYGKPGLRSDVQLNDHDPIASLNHGDDTGHDQSISHPLNEELHNAAPVSDVKEPAVPEESGGMKEENENLLQNDESKKEEQIYDDLQTKRESYFYEYTAACLVQFTIAVMCFVISCVVLFCVEKLCPFCRKYGLAAVALVFAMSAFSQFVIANKNYNEQGATIAAIATLRAEMKQRNWKIGNTTTQLKEKDQLIGNTTKEIQALNISLNEQINLAIGQNEMHKNIKMLERIQNETMVEKDHKLSEMEKIVSQRGKEMNDTSAQLINYLKVNDERQQKEIAKLTKGVNELEDSIQSQKKDLEYKRKQAENSMHRMDNQRKQAENEKSRCNGELNSLKEICTVTVWQLTKDYKYYILAAVLGVCCLCICCIYCINGR